MKSQRNIIALALAGFAFTGCDASPSNTAWTGMVIGGVLAGGVTVYFWLARRAERRIAAGIASRTAELRRTEAELRERADKFRNLVENADDPVGWVDAATGRITECNLAAAKMFGAASREQLLSVFPWDISPEFQPDGRASMDKARELIGIAVARGAHRFNWLHRRLDGALFHVEVSLTSTTVNGQPAMIFFLHDINALKRAEEDLRRNLERERELNELKSNFVSMVSHEFRTPLGIISSSAQILDHYFARISEAERHEHLTAISTSVKRMAGMMEKVLVLARMDGNRLDFAPATVELDALCRMIVDEMRSASPSVARPIECELDPAITAPAQADEHLLRHVLANLISNAVKYSPPDKAARLQVHREGRQAVFTVSDEGIGIPESDRARLFESFHRGKNVGQIAGTGLGLVITKRCVDLHGGTIAFESAEGRGTTVVVKLPLWENATDPAH